MLHLHTKFCGNQSTGTAEDFLMVFTIYGHGGHLCHDQHHVKRFSFPCTKKLTYKIWFRNGPVVYEKSQF